MLIVEPYEMRMMGRELKSPEFDADFEALSEIHANTRAATHSEVMIPKYWAPTVLSHLKQMLSEFPNLKFGGIIEDKNRLKLYTIPTHRPVELLKVALYNDIDTLVLDTIDRLVKGDTKPLFLRI